MTGRYEELDSLRGLAALSVFFGHMYLIFNESLLSNILFEFGPFRVFIAGGEGVTLFFVLSGFVLSLPFLTNKKINYFVYVIKRICRIYIPYIIAFLFTVIARELFYTSKVNSLSDWFNGNWSTNLDFHTVESHLILIDTFSSNLNNVVWSLVHEMRISFIFPIIMAILLKISNKKGVGLGIVVSLISVLYCTFFNPTFYGTELYTSIHYCAMFIIGAVLAKNREKIISRIRMINVKFKRVLFIFGIILYLYAHPSFLLNIMINDLNPYYRTVIDSWFTSMGAAILIVFAISSNSFSKVLRIKFINHIGKISYSLYLSHLAVLLSCVHFFLNKQMPIWLVLLIVPLVTFIVSNIMYYLIEKPSIKLGRFLTSSFSTDMEGKGNINETIKIF